MSAKRLGLALRRMARQFAHGDAYQRAPDPKPIRNPIMNGYGRGIYEINHSDHNKPRFERMGLSGTVNRRF